MIASRKTKKRTLSNVSLHLQVRSYGDFLVFSYISYLDAGKLSLQYIHTLSCYSIITQQQGNHPILLFSICTKNGTEKNYQENFDCLPASHEIRHPKI